MRVLLLPALLSGVSAAMFAGAFATVAPASAETTGTVSTVVSRAQAATLGTLLLAPAARAEALARRSIHPNLPRPSKSAKVVAWVVDGSGYILGKDAAGKIVTYHNDCAQPGFGRVDGGGDLVVACLGGQQQNGVPGYVNIYRYGNLSGPADLVLQDGAGYIPFDAFRDGAGNVYVVNGLRLKCSGQNCNEGPGNIERWSVGNQKNNALPDKRYADANLFNLESGDIDAAGTLYVAGFTAIGGTEIDALSNGTVTDLKIATRYPGGVYVVTPGGKAPRLSVIDQVEADISQYALPISPGALPLVTDGTPENREKSCDPVGGGYGPGGVRVLIGLNGCKAIAAGSVGSGKFRVELNLDYVQPNIALPVPSDK